jgi:hypothetical protein
MIPKDIGGGFLEQVGETRKTDSILKIRAKSKKPNSKLTQFRQFINSSPNISVSLSLIQAVSFRRNT